jgi:hypothetical protein
MGIAGIMGLGVQIFVCTMHAHYMRLTTHHLEQKLTTVEPDANTMDTNSSIKMNVLLIAHLMHGTFQFRIIFVQSIAIPVSS